jgi:S-adenosylmethionine-diacylglycerol 3-amino-3-carboxypropyl transferase
VTQAIAAAGMPWFRFLYDRHLVYNQCWEDPRVDEMALRLRSDDRVLAITSAGCNVLDYALSGAQVLAVDANPLQNHLLSLKIAGIRSLDFEAFFELFGAGGSVRAEEMYRDALRPQLNVPARSFWDCAIAAFVPGRSRGGSFYYSGTAGLFARLVRYYLEHVAALRRGLESLLAADGIGEQVEVYRRLVRPRLLGDVAARIIGSRGVLSLVGVPGPQRELVASCPGGIAGYLRSCLDHVMSVALLRENYFWSVYITGSYARGHCPEYLKPGPFERLKTGLVDNVSIRTGLLVDVVGRSDATYSVFVLLDHMDWLAGAPSALEAEWRELAARAEPGARVIFRSGASDASFLPRSVYERLRFDEPRAATLHRLDRVGTYGSFHIAELDPAPA